MNTTPIILVPGFWLGGWAWDGVAAALRADGHDVTALTLPGLESVDTDRSSITLADHVEAIREAVRTAGRPVLLAVHSGAGVPGYAVTDRIPERIAAMVYVDSGPGKGPLDPDFAAIELPLPSWDALEQDGSSLAGLSEAQLDTFRRRAVPEPGAALRDSHPLTNEARLDVPSTVVCTSMTSDEIKAAVAKGYAWIAGLAELRNVTYVDLPTGHWPMWSRPEQVASLLGGIAQRADGP
ncbi:MAG: alpha/beta hydrolase [Acidimicrobiales bacterium]|jgi:pimeloyl-ACP methyl ester carboxylesterase